MRIRWTQPAVNDLTAISDYIEAQDGAAAAHRIALAIYERISSLTQFPGLGRTGRIIGTRELVITRLPYLAIYRIRGDVLEVNRILHGAQKWP